MNNQRMVIHPPTGAWGVAEEGFEKDLFDELKKETIPDKNYRGTHSIILNATDRCNLGCIYCSASDNRSDKDMDPEVARRAVDEALKLENTPRIVFHGSEPLANMPLIESTVAYGETLPHPPLFYIQSNLTLLTPEKLDFIRRHNIGVSTSIDGSREQHNLTRPFRNGSPTYDVVLRNMEKVLEHQTGMCTVTVVTKHNVSNLSEIALDLESKGVTHIQFLPVVKCSGPDHRPKNEDLTRSFIDLFDQTFQRMESGIQKAVIRNIPQLLSCMFIRTGVDSCRICSSADYHPILAVDFNGDLYPCDYFFRNEQFKIGNILQDSLLDLLNSRKNFRNRSIDDTACSECEIRRICGGGCMADRVFSGERPYYCQTYDSMFRYLGLKMPELIEKGLIQNAMKNL